VKDITYLRDECGELCAVQLSPGLWEKVKGVVLAVEASGASPSEAPEPLEKWEEFKKYWDFKYPFRADVRCLHCGTSSDDWEHDSAHPFRLLNAHIGGLLVFRCKNCGAAVRKKHFTDHAVFEVSPPGLCRPEAWTVSP
jgi:hypothetical protein